MGMQRQHRPWRRAHRLVARDKWERHLRTPNGFSLIEVIVSSALLIVLAASVAQLAAMSNAAVYAAGSQTTGLLLAVQRVEQLRGLAWGVGSAGRRVVIDLSTDLSKDPPSRGGRGLRSSPHGSLEKNIPGYVDYLDRQGHWIGSGSEPPPGTSYLRRWSIQPHASPRNDILVIEVLVVPLWNLLRGGRRPPRPNDPGVVWLSSLKGPR